jgi:hypothetical protein
VLDLKERPGKAEPPLLKGGEVITHTKEKEPRKMMKRDFACGKKIKN